MIGYLFISAALAAGTIKSYCAKKTSGYVQKSTDAVFISLIRMLICIIVGAILIVAAGDISHITPDIKMLPIYLLSGVSTSAFVVFWLMSVRKNAYMLIDVFLMLGMLIPLSLSNLLFDEPITLKQWVGIAILFVAVLIMCSYNSSLNGKMGISSIILLVLTGVASSFSDFSQKLFVRTSSDIPISVFNFYTYVISAITLLIYFLIFRKSENIKNEETTEGIPKKMYAYVAIMAICLFANTYFKTVAALHLDGAQLYPLAQGGALIIAALMAAICFGEKLTLKAITGIVLSFIALIIINVL